MAVNEEKYNEIINELRPKNVQLVAVSKLQSIDDIKRLYALGQRDFGENYVQELLEKQPRLPADTHWHFIGHLQSNKVKYIAPFVHLIQGVDSLKLLQEINKQAKKINKIIKCLLQVHIAQEDTKFGLDENELKEIMDIVKSDPEKLANVHIDGLMGMASFSDDSNKVRNEMKALTTLFEKFTSQTTANCQFSTLSMGMSGDYKIAIEEGSNMVRIGSLLFGARPK
ncbi:YggS family pyridoxal phosphate-dependent enzyme [Segetibacter koreensis]|uniref:YggS family pyridoxal phosphate-dependent enzyme n=1 Tax=Segetibacter koreensis TaxID=398037 RepID=UPI00036F8893|nr:YggS family pyridoxal phosphate-dependent enzyme [Segetibacter koreensis]